jgi:hypothetical protein
MTYGSELASDDRENPNRQEKRLAGLPRIGCAQDQGFLAGQAGTSLFE